MLHSSDNLTIRELILMITNKYMTILNTTYQSKKEQ